MIDSTTHASGGTRTFSRKTPLYWPLMLSAILTALVIISLLVHESMLMVLTFFIFLPAAVIAWQMALRGRGAFLELSVTGIRAVGHEIPWRNLANYRVMREQPGNIQTLTLELNEPLPAFGWAPRLNSFLSRGTSDRVLSISLRYAEEKPEIIDAAIHNYWRGMVGDDITFAAAGKQIAKYQRELRGFSALPVNEKRRSIIGATVFLLMLGWCWHGALVPFMSSAAWSRASWWFAAAVTATGLYALLRKSGFRSLRNQDSTIGYLVAFLCVFVMLTTGSWFMVGRSLPDVVTRLLGTPREFTARLRKETATGSKDNCEGYVTGGFFDDRFPSAYCPSSEEFARLPPAGPMRVMIRESWFGMHIDGIEPVDLK